MAANITYSKFDPVLRTPDYSFLTYILDKKNQQYERGLKSVASSYQTLQKDLTSSVNRENRDQYLKNAQSELLKVSSSDLSLQGNVNAANAVFEPMATNEAFLYDAYHTANNKKQLQKMEQWRTSTDLKEREKFNQDLYEWVQRDLDVLRNDKTGNVTSGVQGRSAFAYVDAQEIINKAAKDSGFKVEKDIKGQPYIVHVEGGKSFAPNYKEFARQVLASNNVYQQQVDILGQNKAEKTINYYKAQPENAGLDNTALYAKFADANWKEMRNSAKTNIESIGKDITKDDADLNAYMHINADKINAGDPSTLDYIRQRKEALDNANASFKMLQEGFNNDYGADTTSEEEKRKAFAASFVKDPKEYFKRFYQENDVTRFSNIRSTSEVVTIKEDTAYSHEVNARNEANKTLNTVQNTQYDNAISAEKLKIDQAELLLKQQKAGAKSLTEGTDKNGDGIPDGPDIKYTNVSGNVVTSTQKLVKLKDKVNTASNTALDNMTGTFGGLHLLESMGMDPEKVGLLRTEFSDYHTSGTAKAKGGATGAAMNTAYTTIFGYAKENKNEQLLTKLRELHGKNITIDKFPELLKLASVSFPVKDENDLAAKNAVNDFDENMKLVKKYSDDLQNGKKLVIDSVKDDSDFKNLLVTRKDSNGNTYTDLINADDIYNRLKKNYNFTTSTKFGFGSENVKLSDKDLKNIAESYYNGTLNTDVQMGLASFNYNGKEIVTQAAGFPMRSSDYANRLKQINEKISIPDYDEVTGSPFYDVSGETEKTILRTLADVTMANSNIYERDESTAEFKQSEENQTEIRNLIGAGANDKKFIGTTTIFTSAPMQGGGQAVRVTFPPADPNDKTPSKYAGRSFFFPITPSPTSPEVFNIFSNVTTQGVFEENIKSGKPYYFNNFEADGIKVKMIPDQAGSRAGKIYLERKEFNPVTKTYSNVFTPFGNGAMPYNLNTNTFDDIKKVVMNDFILDYVRQKIAFKKQQQPGAAALPEYIQDLKTKYGIK
jgi:hypothetical protein